MNNPFHRLDAKLLLGQIQHRWFVVAKPPGFTLYRTPEAPSIVSFLDSKWISNKEPQWFFPYSLEVEAQGIVVVTRDAALSHEISQGLLKRYRLLCDIRKPRRRDENALFEHLQGSLVDDSGNLLEQGALSSQLCQKPWRLREDLCQKPWRLREDSTDSSDVVRATSKSHDVPSSLAHLLRKNRGVQSIFGSTHLTEFQCVDSDKGIGYYFAQPLVNNKSSDSSATQMVRAHFAHAGSPLIFDALHHPEWSLDRRKLSPHSDRVMDAAGPLALQLFNVIFPHPFDARKEVFIEMEAPEEWRNVLDIDLGCENVEVRSKPTLSEESYA